MDDPSPLPPTMKDWSQNIPVTNMYAFDHFGPLPLNEHGGGGIYDIRPSTDFGLSFVELSFPPFLNPIYYRNHFTVSLPTCVFLVVSALITKQSLSPDLSTGPWRPDEDTVCWSRKLRDNVSRPSFILGLFCYPKTNWLLLSDTKRKQYNFHMNLCVYKLHMTLAGIVCTALLDQWACGCET